MTYRVLWAPHAEARLEDLLREATQRHEIATAAREIDQRLIAAPLEFGESRYDTVRVGFVRPLGVLYDVLADVRSVVVYDVWRLHARRS